MTIINNLRSTGDIEELERYERDFDLISLYLTYRRKALEIQRDLDRRKYHDRFAPMFRQDIDSANKMADSIWDIQFPDWIRELLTRDI